MSVKSDLDRIPQIMFSVAQTAKILGIPTASVRKLIQDGLLPSHKSPGVRAVRIPKSGIDTFIKKYTADSVVL